MGATGFCRVQAGLPGGSSYFLALSNKWGSFSPLSTTSSSWRVRFPIRPSLGTTVLLLLSRRCCATSSVSGSTHISATNAFLFPQRSIKAVRAAPLCPAICCPTSGGSGILPTNGQCLTNVQFLFPQDRMLRAFFPCLVLLRSIVWAYTTPRHAQCGAYPVRGCRGLVQAALRGLS